MVEYTFEFICDHCGAPIKGSIFTLYPQTVWRDDPLSFVDEEPEECEEMREKQANHVYCHHCTQMILSFANERPDKIDKSLSAQKTKAKRGRPPKYTDITEEFMDNLEKRGVE